MQKLLFFLLLLISTTFTSCEVIGDIFEAGVWVGIVIVVIVIAIIVWLINRFRR